MALFDCPECGNSISDTVKKCPHCGYGFRKKRINTKIVITTIGFVVVAIIIFCTWVLVATKGDLRASLKIVSGEWGCLIQHTWEEATCQHPSKCTKCGMESGKLAEHIWEEASCKAPKTCVICGLTEGETVEHQWIEATCTTPKTCRVCHKTTGSAKGHTTRLGKCSSCGEFVNDLHSEATSIFLAIASATNNINEGYNYANQSADSYFGYYCIFSVVALDFSFAKTDLDDAIKACGSYEEFAEAKRILTEWKNAIPTDCKDSNSKEVLRYDNDLKNFLEISKNYSNDFKAIFESWGIF